MGRFRDWWDRHICGQDETLETVTWPRSSTYTVPRGQPIGSSLRFATQADVDRIATLQTTWDSPSEFGREMTRQGFTGMRAQRLWFPANVQFTSDRMIEVEGRGEIRPIDRRPGERWRWTERDARAVPWSPKPSPELRERARRALLNMGWAERDVKGAGL